MTQKRSSTTRPRLAGSVLDLVGATPMTRLNRIPKPGGAVVLAKMESLNPGGSVKDRIAVAMVEDAEQRGILKPGATLVEPTSGNTGIGLAMVCAEIHLTPAIEGMTGAVFAAQEMCKEHPEYFMPMQFENKANPDIHRRTTALEILEATEERIDAFVTGVGTGGTITGVGEVLKERIPGIRVIGVEPARSPVLSGGRPRPHGIQGIGASFVPGVLNREILDDVIQVRDEDATATARRLAREEGLLVGISSGANVWAACQVASTMASDRIVVTVLCDTGERYLSVAF
jgi:cysteine synthase